MSKRAHGATKCCRDHGGDDRSGPARLWIVLIERCGTVNDATMAIGREDCVHRSVPGPSMPLASPFCLDACTAAGRHRPARNGGGGGGALRGLTALTQSGRVRRRCARIEANAVCP